MQKLKGRLLFMGWFNRPWKLVTDAGEEIDLYPIFHNFLLSINNKRVSQKEEREGYTLCADEKSVYKFEYYPEEEPVLILKHATDKWGGVSNIGFYLEHTLSWLSGRKVEIEIEDGKSINYFADKTEEVLGLYFVHGNTCKVPEGVEKTVCKVNQKDCCIFLTMSPDGFECEKFYDHLARQLLDRLAKGQMRATRIGNCAILGRKEQKTSV